LVVTGGVNNSTTGTAIRIALSNVGSASDTRAVAATPAAASAVLTMSKPTVHCSVGVSRRRTLLARRRTACDATSKFFMSVAGSSSSWLAILILRVALSDSVGAAAASITHTISTRAVSAVVGAWVGAWVGKGTGIFVGTVVGSGAGSEVGRGVGCDNGKAVGFGVPFEGA